MPADKADKSASNGDAWCFFNAYRPDNKMNADDAACIPVKSSTSELN